MLFIGPRLRQSGTPHQRREAHKQSPRRYFRPAIISEDWQHLIATAGIASGFYSRRTSFCARAVASSSPIIYVADAKSDPRFAGNPAI